MIWLMKPDCAAVIKNVPPRVRATAKVEIDVSWWDDKKKEMKTKTSKDKNRRAYI